MEAGAASHESAGGKFVRLDEFVSAEWRDVASELPSAQLIDEILDAADIKPAGHITRDAAGIMCVDIFALARASHINVGSAASGKTRKGGKAPTIPAFYTQQDARFVVARKIAEKAVSGIAADCRDGTSKGHARCRTGSVAEGDVERCHHLGQLGDPPAPIELDAIASAILMPTEVLHERMATGNLKRVSIKVADAFGVPPSAAKLRLLTPGVFADDA